MKVVDEYGREYVMQAPRQGDPVARLLFTGAFVLLSLAAVLYVGGPYFAAMRLPQPAAPAVVPTAAVPRPVTLPTRVPYQAPPAAQAPAAPAPVVPTVEPQAPAAPPPGLNLHVGSDGVSVSVGSGAPAVEPTVTGTNGWYGGLAGHWEDAQADTGAVPDVDRAPPETEAKPVNLPAGLPTATAIPAKEWNCGDKPCAEPTPQGWGGGSGSGW